MKTFGLELLDEYEFPEPMPEDKIYDYHVDTNQAYLMLATEGTGTINLTLYYITNKFLKVCLIYLFPLLLTLNKLD